ncbi:11726_t:CDS:2 [Gigaspora rosea]|nr:11726_t:CDS:2 [Gigaspora rosea]
MHVNNGDINLEMSDVESEVLLRSSTLSTPSTLSRTNNLSLPAARDKLLLHYLEGK